MGFQRKIKEKLRKKSVKRTKKNYLVRFFIFLLGNYKKKRRKKIQNKIKKMADDYVKYTFGDTEFLVPSRYIELSARGTGAQGMVV